MSPHTVLALLLQYPDAEIIDARANIAEAVRELAPSPRTGALLTFLPFWSGASATALQAHYVATFDLGRRCALHLTYPLFGDRRERGMALLRLKRRYAGHGFVLGGAELPDYLPVMLEYAAADPDGGVLLAEHRVPLEVLRLALQKEGSPYAHLLDAVCAELPSLGEAERATMRRIIEEGPPMETVGLEPFAPPEVMPAQSADLRR